MNNYYFVDLMMLGSLKIDRVLFESYHPLLFTCLDEYNNLFLCVCCHANNNEQKWLITNVSPQTILDLLNDKITIRDSFLKEKGNKYTIIYRNHEYFVEENNKFDWDQETSQSLPTPGEYIESDENEFVEEINHYKRFMENAQWKNIITKLNNLTQTLNQLEMHIDLSNKIKTDINFMYNKNEISSDFYSENIYKEFINNFSIDITSSIISQEKVKIYSTDCIKQISDDIAYSDMNTDSTLNAAA